MAYTVAWYLPSVSSRAPIQNTMWNLIACFMERGFSYFGSKEMVTTESHVHMIIGCLIALINFLPSFHLCAQLPILFHKDNNLIITLQSFP